MGKIKRKIGEAVEKQAVKKRKVTFDTRGPRVLNYQTEKASFYERLRATTDVYALEAVLRDVAICIGERPYVMQEKAIAFMAKTNKRVEGARIPPCTFFNAARCEYRGTLVHQTRGFAQKGRPMASERAHLCAVCFAQQLVSPHRAVDCPIVKELDAELDYEQDCGWLEDDKDE